MTSLYLATWLPVLAEFDPVDLIGKGLGFGAAGTVLYLVISGVFRLSREVEAAEDRAVKAEADRDKLVAAADVRTAVERARAERLEESRDQMQASLSGDLGPALLRVSNSAEGLAKEQSRIAELLEQLIRSVVRVMERP